MSLHVFTRLLPLIGLFIALVLPPLQGAVQLPTPPEKKTKKRKAFRKKNRRKLSLRRMASPSKIAKGTLSIGSFLVLFLWLFLAWVVLTAVLIILGVVLGVPALWIIGVVLGAIPFLFLLFVLLVPVLGRDPDLDDPPFDTL